MSADIRPASRDDGPAIARVRRESWRAAYAGIIEADLIDRATAPGSAHAQPPPYRSTLVAVGPEDPAGDGAVAGGARAVVGYAAYGPERSVPSAFLPTSPAADGASGSAADPSPPGSLTPAGQAGQTGELYAIYLTPAWWSAGLGRALTDAVLAELRAAGYRQVVLWTLTGNARARRFYQKAGFTPDGATNVLAGLGGVEELRYVRDL